MIETRSSISEYLKNNFGYSEELPFNTLVKSYPKNFCLISLGDVEKDISFLVSGVVEAVVVKENGDERVIDFFFKNNFFCSLSSFLSQQPSDVFMTCLTDCVIETMSYIDYSEALKKSLIVNKLGRRLAEQSYLSRIKREKDMLTKTVSERYVELVKDRPEVIKEIPLVKIAKYLGIDPRSLSRIRSGAHK